MNAHAVEPVRLPPAVPAAIVLAWAAAAAAELSGTATLLHHDSIAEGGLPAWAALPVFLTGWVTMIAAMMLPSSLPLVRLFAAVGRGQPQPRLALGALLAGYAAVWTAFGFLALGGDLVLHRLVESSAWLAERQWLVAGGVLLLAGGFQFSSLKARCLDECRHPAAFLLPRYRHGEVEAFRLGVSHGLFCLGCCWALMLLMFAVGVASIAWMAALAAVMVYEKTGRRGRAFAPAVGLALLAWGSVVVVQPAWLPAWLSGL